MRSVAVAVRLGVRSCRPAGQARVSVLDGCPGGVRVVSGRRFGSVHPDRLSCLEGAGEQDERALAIGEAALGPDHPHVATIRDNLDAVLWGPPGGGARRRPRTEPLGIL